LFARLKKLKLDVIFKMNVERYF